MIQMEAEPSFGWKLQGPADEVSYDVGMTNEKSVAVFLLISGGLVKVLAESGLYTRTVSIELSHFRFPMANRGLWRHWSPLSQQIAVRYWNFIVILICKSS